MCIYILFSDYVITFCTVKLQTPRIVSLLSESYNPHVRYGAALAVGISCAGTGLSEAISLLEPLTSDVVDFVRQGALIAMAMVMVQMNEASDSRVGTFRYCNIMMYFSI
jgi:26S proteasome regulatory subunit N2